MKEERLIAELVKLQDDLLTATDALRRTHDYVVVDRRLTTAGLRVGGLLQEVRYPS